MTADGAASAPAKDRTAGLNIRYVQYTGEKDMKLVKELVDPELSEPYSIFTYRLFLTPWPQLCHFCYVSDRPVGVVVCKIDNHKSGRRRGYIGMIVVIKEYRKYGIGSELARRAIQNMIAEDVEDIVLECEVSNLAALSLYDNLGFVRDKRLNRYYMTGSDAIRLKLRVKGHAELPVDTADDSLEQHTASLKDSASPEGAQASIEELDEAAQAQAAAETLTELSVQDAEAAVTAALTITPLGGSSKGK